MKAEGSEGGQAAAVCLSTCMSMAAHVPTLMFVFKCACAYACVGLCVHTCVCQGQREEFANSKKAIDVKFPHTVSTQ